MVMMMTAESIAARLRGRMYRLDNCLV